MSVRNTWGMMLRFHEVALRSETAPIVDLSDVKIVLRAVFLRLLQHTEASEGGDISQYGVWTQVSLVSH